jgi:hypothetical protein
MSKSRLVLRNGAITQPFGMEYRQTKINAVESLGMTIEQIGPSIVRVNSLDKAINDRYIAKAISTPIYSG